MLSYSCVWLRSDIYVATQTEVSWDKVGKRSVDAWISCNDYGDIAIEAHLLVRFGEVIGAIHAVIDRQKNYGMRLCISLCFPCNGY